VVLWCDDLELAAEAASDLTAWLGVQDLAATADLPDAWAALKATLGGVGERHKLRARLRAEGAGGAVAVKAAAVQAEDARILGDAAALKRHLAGLHGAARDASME